MFFNRSDNKYIEESYKDELIKKLKIEIENLRKQLKFEQEINNGFVLSSGEYVVGTDLKPGRYSFKLIYGNDGRLETSGRNWVIATLGDKWNGISEYKNLLLKTGQKLTISGNVKVLLQEELPVNIDEDISIIKEKDEKIKKLQEKIKILTSELNDLKENFNSQYHIEQAKITTGIYIGGENIKTGYYDLEVISGKGSIIMTNKNIYENMGGNGAVYYKGLKIARKNKLEVTGTLVIKAIYRNIKSF